MKFDLLTSIGVAVAGLLLSFLVTNWIVPDLEPYAFSAISKNQTTSAGGDYDYASLDQPNNEIFNYNALNPTVEVYVGDCREFDEDGNCVDDMNNTGKTEEDDENGENGGSDENGENGENGGENGENGGDEGGGANPPAPDNGQENE